MCLACTRSRVQSLAHKIKYKTSGIVKNKQTGARSPLSIGLEPNTTVSVPFVLGVRARLHSASLPMKHLALSLPHLLSSSLLFLIADSNSGIAIS